MCTSFDRLLARQEYAAARLQQLDAQLERAEAEAAAELAAGLAEVAAAAEALAAADVAEAEAAAAALRRRLAGVEAERLRKGERTAGLLAAEAAQRDAEAAERAAAAQRAAAAAAQREAAERAAQQAQATAAAASAEAARAAAQASREAADVRAARAAAKAAAAAEGGTGVLVSAAAAAEERELAAELASARALAAPFAADLACKPDRRRLERSLALCVSQLSGTRAQVAAKASEADRLLREAASGGGAPAAAHALLWLVDKLVAQADAQVRAVRGFAFVLAALVAELAPRHAQLPRLLAATLHEACPLAVPKYTRYSPTAFASQDAYFAAVGCVAFRYRVCFALPLTCETRQLCALGGRRL